MWKKVIGDFKKEFTVVFFVILFAAVVELIKASVLGLLTDHLQDILALKWILVFVGFLIIQMVLSVTKDLTFGRLKRKIQISFLDKGVGQYLSENEYRFSKYDLNEIINKMTSEIEVINTQYIQSLLTVISCIVEFMLATLYIGSLNVWFLLFLYVCSFLMVLWNQRFKSVLSDKQKEVMSSKKSWISSLQQFYFNFSVIKEYRLEKMEKEQLHGSACSWIDADYRSNLLVDLLGSVNLEIGLLMFFGVYFICGFTMKYTTMSIGILIAVSQASNMITTPIINFASLRNRMNAAEPIIQSFYDREENVIAERIKTNRIETIKIDLDELKEDGKVLLQDIHLQFDRGKKYMIMGPSGCGKTTLLKMIKGVYDSEAVQINGQKNADLFEDASFTAQKGALFPWTIEKNIALNKKTDPERMKTVLAQVKLDQLDSSHLLRQDNETLSGGEIQRIHLARALYQNKSWIFLDEAFSALDAHTTTAIERLFLDDPDRTLVHICHKPIAENEKYYDEIITMEKGKVHSIWRKEKRSF